MVCFLSKYKGVSMFVVSMGNKKTIKYFFPFQKQLVKNQEFGLGFDYERFDQVGDIGTKLNLLIFLVMVSAYYFQWKNIALVSATLAPFLFLLPLTWLFSTSYSRKKITGDKSIFISPFYSDWSSKYISSGVGNLLVSLGILISDMAEKHTFIPAMVLLSIMFILLFRNTFYFIKHRNQDFILHVLS